MAFVMELPSKRKTQLSRTSVSLYVEVPGVVARTLENDEVTVGPLALGCVQPVAARLDD